MTAQLLPDSPEPDLPAGAPRLCVVRPLPRYEPDDTEPENTEPGNTGSGNTGPRPPLRLVPGAPAEPAPSAAPPPDGPLAGDRADPATRDAAALVLRTVLEVLDRRRPAAHLAGVLAPALHQRVAASMVAAHRGRPPAHLRSVHAQRSGPGAVEVSARLQRGPRSHAVAARVELVAGRWVATALRIA